MVFYSTILNIHCLPATFVLDRSVIGFQFSSVQFSPSVVSDSWTAARQASLSITNCWTLPKPMLLSWLGDNNNNRWLGDNLMDELWAA